jgi:hypothetical protein
MCESIINKDFISLYVAPTNELLEQTQADIIKELHRKYKLKIPKSHLPILTAKHLAVGKYRRVEDAIRATLRGCPDYKALGKGGVLFLTHEGFTKISSFPRKEEINVYFDEARQFVLDFGGNISFSELNNPEYVRELIKNNSTVVYRNRLHEVSGKIVKSKKESEFRLFSLTPEAVKALAKSIQHSSTATSMRQYSVIQEILRKASNDRLDMYVKVSDKSYTFHEVVTPARVFRGFNYVLLAAAYLTDSQMYHLLDSDASVELVSLREVDPELDLYTDKVERAVNANFRKARIYPLTANINKISSYSYNRGILVPGRLLEKLTAFMQENGVSHELLSNLREKLQRAGWCEGDPVPTDGLANFSELETKLVRVFNKNKIVFKDLIDFYLKTAFSMLGRSTTLVVINERKDHKDQLENFKRDHLVDIVDLKLKSHGSNKHLDKHQIVYLPAINPTPSLASLLTDLIPAYDPDRDFAADAAIQAVTRTSLRVASNRGTELSKSKDNIAALPVKIFVTDLGIANLLLEKMNIPKENAGLSIVKSLYEENKYVFYSPNSRVMQVSSSSVSKRPPKSAAEQLVYAEYRKVCSTLVKLTNRRDDCKNKELLHELNGRIRCVEKSKLSLKQNWEREKLKTIHAYNTEV